MHDSTIPFSLESLIAAKVLLETGGSVARFVFFKKDQTFSKKGQETAKPFT